MLIIIYFIILIFFYKMQRKLCSQPILLRKKMIIPVICLVISIIGTFYVLDTVYNHSNQLIAYSNNNGNKIAQTAVTAKYNSYSVSDNSKLLATLSVSKKQLLFLDIISILVIFNIPTALYTLFIFSSKKFLVNKLNN